jgi:hypothetical protein
MKLHEADTHIFEFAFPALDTLVRVVAAGDDITIRATRDTFSEQRKERFIRELAAEGFIADEFRWRLLSGSGGGGRVRWVVDPSWAMPGPEAIAQTDRWVLGLLGGGILLWLILLGSLFLR